MLPESQARETRLRHFFSGRITPQTPPLARPGGASYVIEPGGQLESSAMREAKFTIGQIVRHRHFPFRGVIFDVDPEFANTEEWLAAIPEPIRPRRDQPFYRLLAENAETHYEAYVSEQNLLPDDSNEPISHPHLEMLFEEGDDGGYRLKPGNLN